MPQLNENGIELRALIANGDTNKAMQVIDNVYIDFSQDGPQLLQVSLFLFLIPAIDYFLSNLGSSPLQSTSNTQKAS